MKKIDGDNKAIQSVFQWFYSFVLNNALSCWFVWGLTYINGQVTTTQLYDPLWTWFKYQINVFKSFATFLQVSNKNTSNTDSVQWELVTQCIHVQVWQKHTQTHTHKHTHTCTCIHTQITRPLPGRSLWLVWAGCNDEAHKDGNAT